MSGEVVIYYFTRDRATGARVGGPFRTARAAKWSAHRDPGVIVTRALDQRESAFAYRSKFGKTPVWQLFKVGERSWTLDSDDVAAIEELANKRQSLWA